MSRSYDDHDGETIEQLRSVLRAVRARINGVFDDPNLWQWGRSVVVSTISMLLSQVLKSTRYGRIEPCWQPD